MIDEFLIIQKWIKIDVSRKNLFNVDTEANIFVDNLYVFLSLNIIIKIIGEGKSKILICLI